MPHIQSILKDAENAVASLTTILSEIEKGSQNIPRIMRSTALGIDEARGALENVDTIVQSVQQSFLFKSKLPPKPSGQNVDAGLRQ